MDQITFSAQNLGAIKSGKFTIKPMTLFCGPNNTGKTWLMYSMYAFLREYYLSSPKNIVEEIVKSLKENGSYRGNLTEFLENNASEYIKLLGLDTQKLSDVFNIDDTILENAHFNCDIEKEALIRNANDGKFSYSNKILECNNHQEDTNLEVKLISEPPPFVELAYHVASILSQLFLRLPKPFLMPAERNGLHLFFRELSAKRTALLHHASKEKIDLHKLFRDVMKSRYALPIADYIDWLNSLPDIPKHLAQTSFIPSLRKFAQALVAANIRSTAMETFYSSREN